MSNQYTWFKDAKGNQVNVSIHPRHWYRSSVPGYTSRGEKVNTCAKRNDQRKGTLAKREAVRSARRTAMAATMGQPSKAESFRVPGSLRGW